MLRDKLPNFDVGWEPNFRWRGGDVSRIENLSDAVFGFFKNILALYILLILFFSLYLGLSRKHMSCLLYGPLIFPVIHFGLGVGFLSAAVDHYLRR